MLICVGMILLDNLLQYFLFIAMIDLSRTYAPATSLICYALVMFMIYSWIKIKSKVLIYLSYTAIKLNMPLFFLEQAYMAHLWNLYSESTLDFHSVESQGSRQKK
jgi:hypothetical protein